MSSPSWCRVPASGSRRSAQRRRGRTSPCSRSRGRTRSGPGPARSRRHQQALACPAGGLELGVVLDVGREHRTLAREVRVGQVVAVLAHARHVLGDVRARKAAAEAAAGATPEPELRAASLEGRPQLRVVREPAASAEEPAPGGGAGPRRAGPGRASSRRTRAGPATGRRATGAPPPGAPGGRAGNVTPCCFRQAASAVRRLLLAPPPLAPPAPLPAADAAVVVLLVVLELLALPQAATRQPRTSAANMTRAPRGALPMSLNLLFLS